MSVHHVRVALAIIALAGPAHALIDDALDVVKLGKEITEEVLSSWDLIGKNFNATGGVELPIIRRREREVLARLAAVRRAIDRVELLVEKSGAFAMLLAKHKGTGARLELRLHEIADLLGRVTSADRHMREYMRYQQELERKTLENFAEWCVSHDPGALPGLLERVHSLIVPPHKHLLGKGLFNVIVEDLQDEQDLCEFQLSQHQLIYDMYNTISLTEIKGYAMMQFSWMLLRIYGKGNFTQEASLTRQRYGERTTQTAATAKAALELAKRDLIRCDPPFHKEGETYAQVTRLLQGYIENEVDMNPDGTCKENCAYYTVAERYGCYKDLYCMNQNKCEGKIYDCQYYDSDMWICPASEKSNRRYEWIEYENGRTLGRPDKCVRGTTKVDSWWRWLFWHCSYCMCVCDDADYSSHRYFSLLDSTTDVRNNKVLTGLRLVKHGRVFHLQISQGTLGERGHITPNGWMPVQKFDPHDMGIQEGVDYHMLNYQNRAIDLDELDAPDNSILTGVRFRMLGSHLHFEARVTPFNYTSGRLYPERSEWKSNDNTDGTDIPRKRLELFRPDIPTRSHVPLPVDSAHDQFLEFTHTDFEADAAQTTVPFVDIQPVEPLKGSSLISGAGIVHRGARGSGGFLAVKLITYKYSKHIHAKPPPNSFDDEIDTTEFVPVVN